jgi:hypothetical protein
MNATVTTTDIVPTAEAEGGEGKKFNKKAR